MTESAVQRPEPTYSFQVKHAARGFAIRGVADTIDSGLRVDAVPSPGTTRDNFQGKAVKTLRYSAYAKLALESMLDIAQTALAKHSLVAVAIVHRLGSVPIGEESILIGVSSGHRQAAWRGGEEVLELTKARVEIWKLEEFEDDEGVWRANRDGAAGVKIPANSTTAADGAGAGDGDGGSSSNMDAASNTDPAVSEQDEEQPYFGPVIRPRRIGERGHGPVVNFRQ